MTSRTELHDRSIVVALLAAGAAAVLERWPGPCNDNVVAPLGLALALVALS